MEYVGPQHRARMGTFIEFSWALAAMAQPGVYYLVRHYQHMQFMSTGYEAIFAIGLFMMSESPRWLLANGHYEKAREIIIKAASQNGKLSMDQIEAKFLRLKAFVESEAESTSDKKKQTLFDLYKEPVLLRNCILLYCIWFAMSFVAYGIMLNIGDLGGNLFINTFVTSLGGFITQLVMIFIVDRITRRHLLFLAYFFAAVSFFVMALVTNAPPIYMTVFAFTGFSAMTIVSVINYVYATEIFPTTVRQIAMGSCGCISRLGSISAPFMRELVI